MAAKTFIGMLFSDTLSPGRNGRRGKGEQTRSRHHRRQRHQGTAVKLRPNSSGTSARRCPSVRVIRDQRQVTAQLQALAEKGLPALWPDWLIHYG